MQLHTQAYLLSKMLCKAYRLRRNQSDTAYLTVNKLLNRELDELIKVDRFVATKQFERAFTEASH